MGEIHITKSWEDPDFFAHRVTSLEALRQRVIEIDAAGCDEAIVAYADLADLDIAARLLA